MRLIKHFTNKYQPNGDAICQGVLAARLCRTFLVTGVLRCGDSSLHRNRSGGRGIQQPRVLKRLQRRRFRRSLSRPNTTSGQTEKQDQDDSKPDLNVYFRGYGPTETVPGNSMILS